METPTTAAALRDYLRALKEESGLSFEDIAQATGEDIRNVKRWLASSPVEPKALAFLRFLAATGVQLSEPAPVGSVNEELRKLRSLIGNGIGNVAFAPSLESLTPNERLFFESYGDRTIEEEEELGFAPGDKEEEEEMRRIRAKIASDPVNQRRTQDVYVEVLAAIAAGDLPGFGPPLEIADPSRLEALEAKVELLATKEDLQRGLDALREAILLQANLGIQPGKAGSGS